MLSADVFQEDANLDSEHNTKQFTSAEILARTPDIGSTHYPRDPAKITTSGAYCRVLTICLSVCLSYSGYFAIVSLLTSFDQDLGYVAYLLLWIGYFPAQFFASPIAVKVLKPKYSLVMAFIFYACFYATNIYPTWYSLPVGAFLCSIGAGMFFWAGSQSYLTNLAYALSKTTGRSSDHYIGSFQGAFHFSFNLSSVAGNAISFAFLLPDQLIVYNAAINSTLSKLNNTASNISSGQCQHDIGVASVSEWAYYGLNSVLTSLGIVAVVLVMLLPPRPRECCKWRRCSTGAVHIDRKCFCEITKKYVVRPLKILLKPSFVAISCLSIFSGYGIVFFNGAFNKHFVSECLGVGIIGPVTMVFGAVAAISSFIAGRVSVYTTRTALAVFAGSLQVAVTLFLMIWEREASYFVVFAMGAAQGLIYGILFPLPAICMAAISLPEERETAFSIVSGTFGIGGAICAVISSFSSLRANLGVMLVILLLGLLMYIIAERMMGCDPCRLTKLSAVTCWLHVCCRRKMTRDDEE